MKLLTKYNWTNVILFVGTIILSHLLFVTSPYEWKSNTISTLAAQAYRSYHYRWIMKTGFVMFGRVFIVGITNQLIYGKSKFVTELPMLVYGLAILISGFFFNKIIYKCCGIFRKRVANTFLFRTNCGTVILYLVLGFLSMDLQKQT